MLWIIPVGINFKGLREMMIFSYNLKIFFFQYFIHIIKMVTHNGNFYCDSNKKRTMIYFLFSRLHHSSCKSFIHYLIYVNPFFISFMRHMIIIYASPSSIFTPFFQKYQKSYSIFTIDDLISLIHI
ncbi:hypothetical protein GLOIN_2v54267 [Rhizophagus irregularis DAOM 181602=DAOM 197198]|uniref:Uncharacterized protein n=1 Tax=Rhizophagus irregularis (strain DAOM 181602 / DAOM 197198 / MUCL 43194) TaxID=747089 RepID=A0A2P4Q1P5_RHIID|nr:hypothetical protein GLOIN_2v54267 [Rhizophagus irregularis DAOM 181602=DAOM 197198]POG71546.1 hypothetical protein GLOIN_2v54267 [Rhizophagus irregularis DAOM 181602=DAOM 197198]|eukprot:XP_025178412.1 hypothetical protein GLOIN_2v54267 [Rhizophagus irregularis DAOM 181602=DAOM 197198]